MGFYSSFFCFIFNNTYVPIIYKTVANITQFNLYKILQKIDIDIINIQKKSIFKKPINLFSKKEIKKLSLFIDILENPQQLFTYKDCMKRIDTFTYVFEATSPAYHYGIYCNLLYQPYINYKICKGIRNHGPEMVQKIREVIMRNRHLIDDQILLEKELKEVFGMQINLEPSNINGKRTIPLTNINLVDIERKIENILSRSNDSNIKRLVTPYLLKYNILKYNPSFEFPRSLLDYYGFIPCKKCHNPGIYLALENLNKRHTEIKTIN